MTTRSARRHRRALEDTVATSELLGYTFVHPELLTRALTHRSLSSENFPDSLADPAADNEQLEFLGDAILGMVAAERLFHLFPQSHEGELTRLRASIVSRKHLGEVARNVGLGELLRLGRGEDQNGGREKTAILADAFEAVIAALYLDGGMQAAQALIDRHVIEPSLPAMKAALDPQNIFSGSVGDHKSALQEQLQAAGMGQPMYVLLDQIGPDHQKMFRMEVRVAAATIGDPEHTEALAEAVGSTKKQAQQAAAQRALARLAQRTHPGGDS